MIIDKDNIKILLIILVLGLGIGYAYINSDLNINGTAQVNSANWDVHWANIQVTNGSVSASSPTISNQTTVNYSVILNTPGDYYEFTVDAVNGGSIDAMIDTIDSKLNGATITTLPAYLKYSVSYSDGMPLEQNHQLLRNTTEKYKVRIEYNTDIELNQIPASNQTLSLQFTVTYRQATDDAIAVDHSFNGHSWETIINNVRSGNIDIYTVGDTKSVDMETFGTQTIRIANKSTPAECSTTGFSQTACGLVLEFVDQIAKYNMNSTDTNLGGWPATSMRSYLNGTVYNAMPAELRNIIITTTVVSGRGSGDSNNLISIDKVYLLGEREVGFDLSYDKGKSATRILDFYNEDNQNSRRIKNSLVSSDGWWLRSTNYTGGSNFDAVSSTGRNGSSAASNLLGASPAFRIG